MNSFRKLEGREKSVRLALSFQMFLINSPPTFLFKSRLAEDIFRQ